MISNGQKQYPNRSIVQPARFPKFRGPPKQIINEHPNIRVFMEHEFEEGIQQLDNAWKNDETRAYSSIGKHSPHLFLSCFAQPRQRKLFDQRQHSLKQRLEKIFNIFGMAQLQMDNSNLTDLIFGSIRA